MVFAFFANPENLPPLMPKWQKARIEEAKFASPPPRPVAADPARRFRSFAAGSGSEMTISFRPFPYCPIRVPWAAKIVEFAWNDFFCDEQLSGPFRYWRHCHRVAEEVQDGTVGTRVKDELEYELPFARLGDVAQTLFVGRQIRGLFARRQQRLPEILAAITRQSASRAGSRQ